MKQSKVFAPATIANIGPGFDIFGLALHNPGDVVEAKTTDKFKGVKLVDIIDNPGLPLDENNVVQAVGQKVLDASKEDIGIELILHKNMKIGTGMGSSAASSVAAAVAINSVLERPFKEYDKKVLEAVFHGENVATNGSGHLDNVLPSLFGGFIFINDPKNYSYSKFNINNSPHFVVASPDLVVNTGEARRALKSAPYNISGLVEGTCKVVKEYMDCRIFEMRGINPLSLIKGPGEKEDIRRYMRGAVDVFDGIKCGDIERLGKGIMNDNIITPVRARFITGYNEVKQAALDAGAYGFSISGSGPSVFAVTNDKKKGYEIADAMKKIFEKYGINSNTFISTVNNKGTIECEH